MILQAQTLVLAQISGLTVSITPSNSSNKIYSQDVCMGLNSGSESNYRLKAGSLLIGQSSTMTIMQMVLLLMVVVQDMLDIVLHS